ncbi:hypothetical protein GJW-30_1_02515 [Variibacter gotjawalensis]|uniref:Uncharacterized protein n=1 Tax=Variibacter gotjawalensis TaxID=1333996 RepID=A0A0S3PVP8_9BRAD|nr:hypothetical protein [Variibacter gotjawalensis]NIK45802.1 hypothetical protein [Variibacter gotjawalensis]RZS47726.1 hypothetical protein EV661_0119 [Variibacter gotjawalensis]BAT59980.1 hypothetical protein GJW-30_1_02515 [Variibacter gotjawalensis]
MKTCLIIAAAIVCLAPLSSAQAEVRFGRNVYIGGHNFSHQTYGPKRKLRVHLYDRQPRNAGCKWQTGRHSATRVCHLKGR